jgi:hypothetical protein
MKTKTVGRTRVDRMAIAKADLAAHGSEGIAFTKIKTTRMTKLQRKRKEGGNMGTAKGNKSR